MTGPDVAGILTALARLPQRSREQRRLDRFAARVHRSVVHPRPGEAYIRAPRRSRPFARTAS